jgi:hypothetical protein
MAPRSLQHENQALKLGFAVLSHRTLLSSPVRVLLGQSKSAQFKTANLLQQHRKIKE